MHKTSNTIPSVLWLLRLQWSIDSHSPSRAQHISIEIHTNRLFLHKKEVKKNTYEFLRMMVWSVMRYARFMYSFVCCHSRFTGAERCVWIMWTMTTHVNRNLHMMMQESGKKYFLRNTHRIIECRQAYFKPIFLKNELDDTLQIYSILQNWLFFHGIFPRSKRYIVYTQYIVWVLI